MKINKILFYKPHGLNLKETTEITKNFNKDKIYLAYNSNYLNCTL